MKRSEINKAIARAMRLLERHLIKLPAFGAWTRAQWLENREDTADMRRVMLGWDVTDFGSGDFSRVGATLFTLRNGCPDDPSVGTPYAEKLIILFCENEQEIPMHFHIRKTEDIINRGGGILSIQLYGSLQDGSLDEHSPVRVRMDGMWHTFPAGAQIDVQPGGSITLHPGLYHRFWAKQGCGDLIAGEVSSVNDDTTDNVFLNPSERFTAIEEDEAPLFPLCNEH